MSVFYTSDLHIGHKFVAGLRGFWDEDNVVGDYVNPYVGEHTAEALPDTDAHDSWLADIWDSTVKKDDQVFVLGDISINGGQHALDWIAARPGTKHLIAGNHDPVGPWDRRAVKKLPEWLKYFETVQPYLRRKLNGQNLLLSHFPYQSWGDGPERDGSRFDQYRLLELDLPLLHGHTHGTERAHGNMLHVGVDAWKGNLVSQEYVMSWLESLKEKAA